MDGPLLFLLHGSSTSLRETAAAAGRPAGGLTVAKAQTVHCAFRIDAGGRPATNLATVARAFRPAGRHMPGRLPVNP